MGPRSRCASAGMTVPFCREFLSRAGTRAAFARFPTRRRAMAIDTRSFFAGAAGVLAILVLGFGGGVMMSGVLSEGQRQPNKVEKQAMETKPAVAEAKPATPP